MSPFDSMIEKAVCWQYDGEDSIYRRQNVGSMTKNAVFKEGNML